MMKASGGTVSMPGWRWDVALLFAGAQRDYAGQVAQVLKARGCACFYDADRQVRLRGLDFSNGAAGGESELRAAGLPPLVSAAALTS